MLDDKDWKIINVLKEHADYTTRQISKKTLLPISTVHHRIRRLKKERVIKRFTVELDHVKTGSSFLAYILISANLGILKQKKKTQYDLAKEIKKMPFVENADIVTGTTDLVAVIRVRDVHEFDRVLLSRIQMIEGIEKTQSLTVIHHI